MKKAKRKIPGYAWVKTGRGLDFSLYLVGKDGEPHTAAKPVASLQRSTTRDYSNRGAWHWYVSGAWCHQARRECQHYFDGRAHSAREAIAVIGGAYKEYFSKRPVVQRNIAAALAHKGLTRDEEWEERSAYHKQKEAEKASKRLAKILRRRRRQTPAFAETRRLAKLIQRGDAFRAQTAAARIVALINPVVLEQRAAEEGKR